MKYAFLKFLPFLLLTLLFPLKLFAWNALGHMVIAEIAYQQLTPNVRAKVDNIVSQLTTEYPEMKSYMQIAYWPDSLRSQRIETFTHWHYIDNAITNDGTRLHNVIDTDNAVWAVNKVQSIVKNSHANPFDRARFLAFYTHIVGDLHQPLHTVSLFSAKHTDGDRGGNAYMVKYHGNSNLHKMWDSGVGAFDVELNFRERSTPAAQAIMAKYPKSSFGSRVNNLKAEDWTKEGVEIAKKYVYNTPEGQDVSSTYIENNKMVAQQQVALAGYRLGELLNQLLAD